MCRLDRKYTSLRLAENAVEVRPGISDFQNEWAQKQLHGRYYAQLMLESNDLDASTKWLQNGKLHPESEGFVQAVQDQVIATRAHRKFILGEEVCEKCRLCNENIESIQHLTAGCSVLAPTSYLRRHNNVAKIIHLALRRKYNLLEGFTPYYKYKPPELVQGGQVKIYWDTQIITDRAVSHNKPDILIVHLGEKAAHIVDVAIPFDDNVQKARGEKIRKYQELCHELKEMYGLSRVVVVPIVISVNGLVPKMTVEGCKTLGIPAGLLSEAQKSVLLDTLRIVRHALQA